MIIKYLRIFIIIAALMFLAACEKIINEDINHVTRKLVIYSFLSPEKPIEVSVTSSVPILDNDTIIYVSNATVQVYEDGVLLENLYCNSNTRSYTGDSITPFPGKKYRIEVSATNFATASCETVIPIPVQITSLDTMTRLSKEGNNYSSIHFIIKANITDPVSEENYYLMCLENKDYSSISPTTNTDNYIITEFMTKNALVELYSYKPFLNFQQVQNNEDIGFSTNKENYINSNYIAFSDIAFNGKTTSMELELNNYYIQDSMEYRVKLISVSKDYFKNITSMALYANSNDPFTEKVQVYSNVKGGLGMVFASSLNSKSIVRKHY